jgi:hypothetical protein
MWSVFGPCRANRNVPNRGHATEDANHWLGWAAQRYGSHVAGLLEYTTNLSIATITVVYGSIFVCRTRDEGLFERGQHELDERAGSFLNKLYHV